MRHTADDHLDEGTLQAWLDHPRSGLSADEVAAVEAHLAGCEACAAAVEALEVDSHQVADLLGAAPAASPPPFAAVEARARELGEEVRSTPRGTGGIRRWRSAAWAASVAVALGTGWMANELFRTDAGARSGFSDQTSAPPPASEIEIPPPPEVPAEGGAEASTSRARADAAGEPVEAPAPAQADAAPAPARADDASTGGAARESAAPPPAGPPAPTDPLADAARRDPAPDLITAAPGPRRVLRGRVVDAASGRPLESAQIFEPTSGTGTLTDTAGRFTLTVPASLATRGDSAVELQVQLIGYGRADRSVALTSDTSIVLPDVAMESTALRLQQVVVTASRTAPGLTIVPSDTEWGVTEADGAAAELGFAVHVVPDLPVAEVALASVDGVPVARLRQPLPGGDILTLYQAPVRLSVVQAPGADPAVSRELDDAWVAATAPGSPDIAQEWLRRVR